MSWYSTKFSELKIKELTAISRESCYFDTLWFEERVRRAPFSWRISVDSRLDRKNKAAFLYFSKEV